jgi:hypothetical protein
VYNSYTTEGAQNYTVSGINSVSLIISRVDRLTAEGRIDVFEDGIHPTTEVEGILPVFFVNIV